MNRITLIWVKLTDLIENSFYFLAEVSKVKPNEDFKLFMVKEVMNTLMKQIDVYLKVQENLPR